MELNELKDNNGARKSRMRVGRGIGSGKGKTAGRGHKGQKSRSGVSIKGFEGGQMPIHRRLPKRGFNNPTRTDYATITLAKLQKLVDAKTLDAAKPLNEAVLLEAGVVRKNPNGVKLLGGGELKAKLTIEVTKATKGAIAAVEKAGGKVTVKQEAKDAA